MDYPPYTSWGKFPKEEKERAFSRFQEHYQWIPEAHSAVYHAWEACIKRNLKRNLSEYRMKAEEAAGTEDLDAIKNFPPPWIARSRWEIICDKWKADPKNKEKRQQARKNRCSEREGSMARHCGGSIPFRETGRRMANELQRTVSQIEVVERCYRKNKGTGEFVDPKMKRLSEEYHETCGRISGRAYEPGDNFNDSVWKDLIGTAPLKKKRVTGFGGAISAENLGYVSSSSQSTSGSYSSYNPSITSEALQAAVREAVQESEARALEREQRIIADSDARVQAALSESREAIQRMEALVRSFVNNNLGQPPSSPPN